MDKLLHETDNNPTVKMGRIIRIENSNPKFGSNSYYYQVKVKFPNGEEKYLMFTEHDLERSLYRSDNNLEDIKKTNYIRNLFD